MARFRSGGRVYELAPIDEITPRDLITFPRDAAEVRGAPVAWSEVEKWAGEIDALPDDDKESHPEFGFTMAVTIWASRRAAGDVLTFGQCLDEPFSMIEDPEDRKPGKPQARKGKPQSKKKRPQASAPAAEPADEDPSTTATPPTSEPLSDDA